MPTFEEDSGRVSPRQIILKPVPSKRAVDEPRVTSARGDGLQPGHLESAEVGHHISAGSARLVDNSHVPAEEQAQRSKGRQSSGLVAERRMRFESSAGMSRNESPFV